MLKPLPGWQHPVLIMPKDIPTEDLRDILAFMYSGEVSKSFYIQGKENVAFQPRSEQYL